jgi:hypothetical protein
MATIKDFTEKQMEIFSRKLSAKTGWGRNEVKVALLEATNEALAELLSGTSLPRFSGGGGSGSAGG